MPRAPMRIERGAQLRDLGDQPVEPSLPAVHRVCELLAAIGELAQAVTLTRHIVEENLRDSSR